MTAVALARTLAEQARVILVELSLERPSLAAITADPRMPGVADSCAAPPRSVRSSRATASRNVQVIAAGRVGADAADGLRLGAAAIGIEALSRAYDHVIIDAGALPNARPIASRALRRARVLVASGQAAAQGDAVRDLLAQCRVRRHRGVHRHAARARCRGHARRRGLMRRRVDVAGLKKVVLRGGLEALYFSGAHLLLRPLLGGVGAILTLHHVRPPRARRVPAEPAARSDAGVLRAT